MFIDFWQKTDFSKFDESDIREEFIVKLLYLLGYSKNTINDIIREPSYKLSEPFQRVGRKRIKIDYIPSVRLKSFWILEAKPGNPSKMDIGDMLQAYLYATHPEVQVPYIVLCNGWELKIFYIHNIDNWNEPIFTINNRNCREKFSELRKILSANTILSFQRECLLNQIRNTFEVEIDIEQLKNFYTDFLKMQGNLEKKIRENEKQVWKENFESNRRKKEDIIKSADDKTLLIWMNSLANSSLAVNLEYYHRIEISSMKERTEKLRKLLQIYLGRCHAVFKCNCMYIFMKVVLNNLEIEGKIFVKEIKEELENIIKNNLTYCKTDELQNSLCFLDRTCCKFAAVIVKSIMIEKLSEEVQQRRKYLSVEDRICGNYDSVAKSTVPWILTYAELLWLNFSKLGSEEIWNIIWFLENCIDKILDKQMIKEYPNEEFDLLRYEHYGNNEDCLVNSTCHMLSQSSIMQYLDLESELIKIIYSDYPERKEFIPKLKKQKINLEKEQEEKFERITYEEFLRTVYFMVRDNSIE